MNSLILHFVFIFLAISLAMIWAKSSSRSRASYFDGAEWWSRALPTVCCFLYIFILGANIIGFNPKIINISHSFNLPEMIVLFTAGALFFSHYSKHISLFISGYLFFVRVFFVSSLTTQVDVADIYFLLSLTSITWPQYALGQI